MKQILTKIESLPTNKMQWYTLISFTVGYING